MEIQSSSNNVTIKGNIKTVSDFQQIKQCLDSMINTHNHIILDIKNSLSITSSVIGYLNKLVLKDGIDIHMHIGDEQLIELLGDLNMLSTFKAKKV